VNVRCPPRWRHQPTQQPRVCVGSFRGRLDQVGRAHAELRAALDMLVKAAEHAAPPPPSR